MMTRDALDAMYHNRCIPLHLCRDQEDAKYQDDDDPSSSSTGVYHYAGVLGSVKFRYETYNYRRPRRPRIHQVPTTT